MEFEKSATRKNVAKAYASECQDSARYQLMALIANENKQHQKAEQIKKVAKRELAHATILYHILLEYGAKNMENIEFFATFPFEDIKAQQGILLSAQSELAQAQNIYPHYAIVAKDEGFDKIASVFEMLAQVEEQNSIVLNSLLQKQKGNCLVCANCGYYKQTKRFWPHCPLCGKAKGFAHFEQQEL